MLSVNKVTVVGKNGGSFEVPSTEIGRPSYEVAHYQNILNNTQGTNLTVDGVWGPKTQEQFEKLGEEGKENQYKMLKGLGFNEKGKVTGIKNNTKEVASSPSGEPQRKDKALPRRTKDPVVVGNKFGATLDELLNSYPKDMVFDEDVESYQVPLTNLLSPGEQIIETTVLDGDTFHLKVKDKAGKETVKKYRLFGGDAPETSQAVFNDQARAELEKVLKDPKTQVFVKYLKGKDKTSPTTYGRQLLDLAVYSKEGYKKFSEILAIKGLSFGMGTGNGKDIMTKMSKKAQKYYLPGIYSRDTILTPGVVRSLTQGYPATVNGKPYTLQDYLKSQAYHKKFPEKRENGGLVKNFKMMVYDGRTNKPIAPLVGSQRIFSRKDTKLFIKLAEQKGAKALKQLGLAVVEAAKKHHSTK